MEIMQSNEIRLLALGAIFFLSLIALSLADDPSPSTEPISSPSPIASVSIEVSPSIEPSPSVELPSVSPSSSPTIEPSPSASIMPSIEPKCGDICEPHDGIINQADLDCLINYTFSGAPAPLPVWVSDVNGDAIASDVFDIIYLTDFLYNDGYPLDCMGVLNPRIKPTPSPSPLPSATGAPSNPTTTLPHDFGTTQGDPCDGPCKPTVSPSVQASPTGTNAGGSGNATIIPAPSNPSLSNEFPVIIPSPTIKYFNFVRKGPSPATGFFAFGFAPWQWVLVLIILFALYFIFRK